MPRSRRRILGAVSREAPLSRAQLARDLDLSPSTVSEAVSELVDLGLLESVAERGGVGRPRALLRPAAVRGTVLGIDVGRRHARLAVANRDERITGEHSFTWSAPEAGPSILERVLRAARELLGDAHDAGGLDAICLGLPSPLPAGRSSPVEGPILPAWHGVDPGSALSVPLGAPVIIENDATLGALGELRHGAARGESHAIYVKVASGIGAGLVMDGRLYRGSGGTAGELGHFSVDPRGLLCRCGGRGCLETVSSLPALLDAIRPLLGLATTTEEMTEAIRAGDRRVLRPLVDAGRHLGHILAMACNLVNPSLIVVGGPLADAPGVFFESIAEAIESVSATPASGRPRLVRAALGDRSGVIGAVARAAEVAVQLSRVG